MYMVVFALITVVGAWMAWKRNPLYSAASTVRTVLLIAVLIAGVVAAIALVANLTKNSSATVTVVAMGGVVIAATLVMIFGITAVSTPKAAKLVTTLPPTAKLVHFHRQKVYRWAKILVVILAVCGAAGLLPGNVKYVGLTAGGLTLYLMVILLPVMYVTSRNFDRSLTALTYDPWVHWQYPPAQWREWANIQADRAKAMPAPFVPKRDWKKLLLPFAGIAIGVMYFSPGPAWAKALYVLFVCGAITAMVMWSVIAGRLMPDKLRAKLLASAPEAYFGHDGVFCDSAYTTWLGISVYLTSASIDERPPRSLMFNFEKVVPAGYSGTTIVHIHQSVLIPANAEADIARLQRELVARCPTAQIALA